VPFVVSSHAMFPFNLTITVRFVAAKILFLFLEQIDDKRSATNTPDTITFTVAAIVTKPYVA